MADTVKDNKSNTLRWIIALCITAVLAVVGWTTTANLAARMHEMESLEKRTVDLQSTVAANNVRISVLENKYDMIQATLLEIKVLVQRHMEMK